MVFLTRKYQEAQQSYPTVKLKKNTHTQRSVHYSSATDIRQFMRISHISFQQNPTMESGIVTRSKRRVLTSSWFYVFLPLVTRPRISAGAPYIVLRISLTPSLPYFAMPDSFSEVFSSDNRLSEMNCPRVYQGMRVKVLNEITQLSDKYRRGVVTNYVSFWGCSGFEYQSRLATMTGGFEDFPLILTQTLEQ